MDSKRSAVGMLCAIWGLVGVTLFLGKACFRLSHNIMDLFDYQFGFAEWSFTVVWVVFMAYSEGYRGFQKGFSPRVVSRAEWLSRNLAPLRCLLAPVFCMGYFGATKKRTIVAWCVTMGIIALVLVVRMVPQPWRGIVDIGVVLGLAWGVIAMWVIYWMVLIRRYSLPDPEVANSLKNAAT